VGLQAVGLTSRKACGMLDFDDVEEKEINVWRKKRGREKGRQPHFGLTL
jgi:hypothetical protein